MSVRTMGLVGLVAMLGGCLSPHYEGNGKYVLEVTTAERAPLGTNVVHSRLQRCDGPTNVVLFYLQSNFTNCQYLSIEEQYAWQFGYSQGQGGQIVSGMMNAAALGGVAAAAGSAGNAVSNASSTAVTTVTVRGGYRH